MNKHTILWIPVTLGLGVAGAAFAQSSKTATMDVALEQGTTFGFTHYEDIEFKSRGRIEMEGFTSQDGWFAEVTMNANGETVEELRERRIDGPWGMQADDVRKAMASAKQAGVAVIEEIKIGKNGYIDVEGNDAAGRDIEVTMRLGDFTVAAVDRD